MYDFLAAALLADGFTRRHHPNARTEGGRPESESPWSRIFAWQRRSIRD